MDDELDPYSEMETLAVELAETLDDPPKDGAAANIAHLRELTSKIHKLADEMTEEDFNEAYT